MSLDIRLSTNFFRNVKVKKLERLHGYSGVKSLLQLWFYVREEKPEGTMDGMTVDDIELASDWQGNPGDFGALLLELQLIEPDDDGNYQIKDWQLHNPYAVNAEKRIAAAKIAANARWKTPKNRQNIRTVCEPHANRMRTACEPHATEFESHGIAYARTNERTNERTKQEPAQQGADDVRHELKLVKLGQVEKSAEGIPYQEIVELYHQTCTDMPRVRRVDPRRKAIKARHEQYRKDNTDPMDGWLELFKRAQGSDFLTCRNPETNFKADFAWLLKPDNEAKVLEGRYDNRDAEKKAQRAVVNGMFDEQWRMENMMKECAMKNGRDCTGKDFPYCQYCSRNGVK